MPLAYPSGTVAEHRACRTSAVAFDVSHLGTVRVLGGDAFEHLQHSLEQRPDPDPSGPGAVHPPPRRGRVRGRRHHRVVGRRRAVRRDAECLEHHRRRRGHRRERRHRRAGRHRRPGPRGPRPPGAGVARGGDRPSVRRRALRVGRRDVPGGRAPGTPARKAWSARFRPRWPSTSGRRSWARASSRRDWARRDTLRLEAGLPLHGHELGPGITPLQAGPGLGDRVGQGRFHRPGRAGRGAGERSRLGASAASWRTGGSRCGTARCCARAWSRSAS